VLPGVRRAVLQEQVLTEMVRRCLDRCAKLRTGDTLQLGRTLLHVAIVPAAR
jgi:hypothetical protein